MYKLGHLVSGEWIEHSHTPVYRSPAASDGVERVTAGVPAGDPAVFERLTLCLRPPYFILYVLHTPRGEGDAGRYQSPAISAETLREFIAEFGQFLSADARFDIWAHSPEDRATVVWDRHNMLYAYGPIPAYLNALRALGFSEGEPSIPAPHSHHYHDKHDAAAGKLLQAFDWIYSELREEDE